MYKVTYIKELGYHSMASSVAPPYSKGTPEKLINLVVAHLMIHQEHPFTPFLETINNLNAKQLDLVRLPINHALLEIEEKVKDDVMHSNAYIGDSENISEAVEFISNNVLTDVELIIENIKKSPGKNKYHASLNGALEMLIEGRTILENIGFSNKSSIETINLFEDRYNKIKSNLNTLQDIARNYPELATALPNVFKMEKDSISKIKKSLKKDAAFDINMIDDLIDIVGGREYLWKLTQDNAYKKKLIKENKYHELTEDEAKKLKEGISNVFTNFDNYMINSSIVSIIRKSQTLFKVKSDEILNRTVNVTGESIYNAKYKRMKENVKNSHYRDTQEDLEELEADKDNLIAEYKKSNEKDANSGADYAQKQRDLLIGLNELKEKFNVPTNTPKLSVTFTKAKSGHTIGEWSDNSDKVLVVYNDDSSQITDRVVYMIELSKDVIKNGIPELTEELKEQTTGIASNFLNVEYMMNEIENPHVQKHIFNKEFTVINKTIVKNKPFKRKK